MRRVVGLVGAACGVAAFSFACGQGGGDLPVGGSVGGPVSRDGGSSGPVGSGSGGSSGQSETVIIPCYANLLPDGGGGVQTLNTYSPNKTYQMTFTGTCSLYPSAFWAEAGPPCGAVESQPEYPTENDHGPVGNDTLYTFAVPQADSGSCLPDGGMMPEQNVIIGFTSTSVGVAPVYVASHTYVNPAVSPNSEGPFTFFVNWTDHPEASPGFYGALQVVITPND